MNLSKAENRARDFAMAAHWGQKYGEYNYIVHLDNVNNVLNRYKPHYDLTADLLVAGYLHDIIEDTRIDFNGVAEYAGYRIATLVFAVTNEEADTRSESLAKTYLKIKSNESALILKLADRITNVECSIENKTDHIEKYKKEYPGFREALRVDRHLASMWNDLDKLLDWKPKAKVK